MGSIGASGREVPVWIAADGAAYSPAPGSSWRQILNEGSWEKARAEARGLRREAWRPLAGERIGPPIPEPSKIVAIGLNYRDHAEEQGKEPPATPLLFAKAPTCLVGPGEAIRIPPQESRVDAEAELAVVLKRRTYRVSAAQARDAILGFTIMNDVSGREAQYGDKQWFRGKSYDTFGPCGPWIVAADEIDPTVLPIRAIWNDRVMQDSTTAKLICGVYDLVSYISQQMTLLPGDLIATGTPAGVGVFRDPPVFLKPGDRVRIEIEGIGVLENPVSAT
jgi:2-keto-4-pentenoate hydratase/2-oxohepta-3-ene-1,7-dioic acid hydratase in catechol pathway